LYSTARAQNADATYGSYQDLDYVATFVEDQNEKLLTGGYVRVGWDPVVSDSSSAYDGGKVIYGFGKTGAYLQAGWIIKMWGTTADGGQACANDSVITGYVNMVSGLNSELTATTQCNLTSDAKVQWAYTSLATAVYTAGTNDFSIVVLGGTEEAYCGKDNTACSGTSYSEPNYYGVGGAMSYLQKTMKGMTTWQIWIMACNGAGAVYGTNTNKGINEATARSPLFDFEIASDSTTNEVYLDKEDTTAATSIGGFVTNNCLTGVMGYLSDASNGARITIWGFTVSPNTCLDHAADGFTVFGHPFIYKIGTDADETTINRAAATADDLSVGNAELAAI